MSTLFRKRALDQLTAPKVSDERVALIAPRWWTTLLALFLVLCTAAFWGWFGRISTKVNGAGMLLEMTGFRNVVSAGDGVVGYLNVREGMVVEQGEVLGVVAMPLQRLELKFHRDRFEQIKLEVNELNAMAADNRVERMDYFQKLRQGNAESIDKLTQILDKLADLSQTYESFSRQGVVTQVEAIRMLQDMLTASINVTRQRQDNMRTGIEKADFDLNFTREFWQKQQRLLDSEYELYSKVAQFVERSLILSPTYGAIISVQKSSGDRIAAGEVVFLLQPLYDDALYVSAFIPAAKSKSVSVGQLVYISPAHIEPQRTGYMLGIVQRVGRYPASFEQLLNVFKNKDLTQMLQGEEVAVKVEVSLLPDSHNTTGFRWTGKEPEQVQISAGMICHVAIAIEQRAPISYVLPWVREKLLGDVKQTIGRSKNEQ